jgi:hypothetical protein
MAALNAAETKLVLGGATTPLELASRLQPRPDKPLHFAAPVDFMGTVWVPYFEVTSESFSCVPMIEAVFCAGLPC